MRTLAKALRLDDVVELLQSTLDEEGASDKSLTELALNITPAAMDAGMRV